MMDSLQRTPTPHRRLSTPGSPATGRTWTSPSPPNSGRSGTTHGRMGTSSPREYVDEAESDASPIARSSAR